MPTIQKVIIAAMAALLPASIEAQAGPQPIPRIVQKDGRYSLFVDGAPYLMLGGQVLNSSGWPVGNSKPCGKVSMITKECPAAGPQYTTFLLKEERQS